MAHYRLTWYEDPAAFLDRAQPFLMRHEVEHNLPIGLAMRIADDPGRFDERPWEGLIQRDDDTVGVVMRTPPLDLILSRIAVRYRTDALRAVADDGRLGELPGVVGPVDEVRLFSEAWCGSRGVSARHTRDERLHRLTRVRPPSGVSGRLRQADADDLPLIARWLTAFHSEALQLELEPVEARKLAEGWLGAGFRTAYLWEDAGRATCLVAAGSPTPHGIRIGPVYTPPELRGRGYASACTAAVSQLELDAGRRFCCLYTDLANPTANHIYAAIGYRPVADVTDLAFTRETARA
jgi:GNAT superfamily N-acetyltransferase